MKKICTFLLVGCLSQFHVGAQSPVMLKDLNQTGVPKASNPTGFIKCGNTLYFMADGAGSFKSNLFASDGTTAGTVDAAIEDFKATFSFVTGSIPFGNNYVLSAASKLYLSNGTDAGEATLMTDLNNDFSYGLNEQNSCVLGGKLYFWAKTTGGSSGSEMYVTDGTAGGTQLFKEFAPGTKNGFDGFSTNRHVIAAGSKAYIVASDGDSTGVYVTDGTSGGTQLLKNFFLSSSVIADASFYHTVVNGHVFITVNATSIWSINSSNNSLKQLEPKGLGENELINSIQLAQFHMNNEYYYIYDWVEVSTPGNIKHFDVRASDGVTSRLVARDKWTINDNTSNIDPMSYTSRRCDANGKFYFFVHNTGNVQLWITDGTANGTVKARDSIVVSGQGTDNFFTANNRVFYFYKGVKYKLYELSSTHAMTEILDLGSVSGGGLMLDETANRFYFGYKDPVADVEPHYLALGGSSTGVKPMMPAGVNFVVYPNPSAHAFHIKGDFDASETVVIMDMMGREVHRQTLQTAGHATIEHHLAKGIYTLWINGNSSKLMIQ